MNEKIERLLAFLHVNYPDASCGLHYEKPHELLIAVLLSQLCSDQAVNEVTTVLFFHFPTLESLAKAPLAMIEQDIAPLGLWKIKAPRIKTIAQLLLTKHSGVIPDDQDLLLQLPGVGRKTANVVLAELYHRPVLAIDRHIIRISRRLGLVDAKADALVIEKRLSDLLPKDVLPKVHHQLIAFGRTICRASSPLCQKCPLRDFCGEKRAQTPGFLK